MTANILLWVQMYWYRLRTTKLIVVATKVGYGSPGPGCL